MRNKTFAGFVKFVEKFDTILFILGLILVGILLFGIANAYAGVETIKDDNDGNKGYILINTGIQQGNNDIGHWTDIKDVPELKGDKGDKGDTGSKGDIGDEGEQGLQGIQGIKGIQGITGLNGKDFNPKEVNRLDNRINDVENRVDKLEKTQYVAEAEFRVYDNKHLTIKPFVRHNFTRSKTDTIGVRFTIKLGESYEEKEITKTNVRLDKTEARLVKIEEKLVQPAYIEKMTTKNFLGKTTKTSWHIQAQPTGIVIENKF